MALPLIAGGARVTGRRTVRRFKKSAQKRGGMDAPELFSPEGVAMMGVAAAFDLLPPVIILILNIFFGVGELLSWVLDILATITLGVWMWRRGGKMPFGKKLRRFLVRRAPFMAAEYVPIAGAFPFWMLNVFLFLKK